MSITRSHFTSIKMLVGISLCLAFISAADQFSNQDNVVSKTHLKPQLLSPHNNSAPTDNVSKSDNVPKQHTAADGNSDEEARGIKELLNALGPTINRFQGRDISSLTEPLLQTDATIANGDKKLINHLLGLTDRTEAQETFLIATINRFRESENLSDQTFGDFELIHLLTNPKSAEFVYDKWLHEKETALTVIKRLDRSFTYSSPDSSLRKFFKHRSALPWLSFVGYCWIDKKGHFTEKTLLQFFEEAYLEAELMTKLLYNARAFPFGQVVFDRMQQYLVISSSTRALAFHLEMALSGVFEFSHFWQMLLGQKQHLKESPLNVWLEYVAFLLPYATNNKPFNRIYYAVIAFLDGKEMSTGNQRRMFMQVYNDMNGEKVGPNLYAIDLELQPFAKPVNPGEFHPKQSLIIILCQFLIFSADSVQA